MKILETKDIWENFKNYNKKPFFTVYTDAGYSMKSKKGKMARKIGDKEVEIMKNVKVPLAPTLKQFTNLLELRAVLWALEETPVEKDVHLFTDSKVVVSWVEREKNNLGKFTKFHKETKEKIDEIKGVFKSFSISWVSREKNPAGKALEEIKF